MYNIIFLTIDALRADHLGCYGYNKNISSTIDNIAQKGIRFQNAISTGTNTPSSFTSIFSQEYPSMHNGILTLNNRNNCFMNKIKKYDFQTAAFHCNPNISRLYGYHKGFDIFFDDISSSKRSKAKAKRMKGYLAPIARKTGFLGNIMRKFYRKYTGNFGIERHVSGEELNDLAMQSIKGIKQPFYLWIHYMEPHHPWFPPEKYYSDLSLNKIAKINEMARNNLIKNDYETKMLINLYDSCIKNVDDIIKNLLGYLEDINKLNNSYIILTSDHGQQFLEHGSLFHQPFLYEENIHVPLIIIGPNISHTIIKKPIGLMELGNLIEIILKNDNDELLDEKITKYIREDIEDGTISEASPLIYSKDIRTIKLNLNLIKRSYRDYEWKFIYNKNSKNELYRLSKDPIEKNNLINLEKDLAIKYLKKLIKHEIIISEHNKKINYTP